MITPLAFLAATLIASPVKSRTVELSDPRLQTLPASITSVTVDGDTAYVVTGNTVKKAVYGDDLKIVDSLPPRGGQVLAVSKYVHLGDGLGILANGGAFSDTSFWMIDWKGTSRTATMPYETGSRWAAYQGMGFKTIASGGSAYGFSPESNLDGIKTSGRTAIFAGDKGVFMLTASRADTGKPIFTVVGSQSDSGKFLWSNVSLAIRPTTDGSTSEMLDFAGNSWYKKIKLFHSDYATDDLGWLKLVDSSLDMTQPKLPWNWGYNLASGTGRCWMNLSYTARLALHICSDAGAIDVDTIAVPALESDTTAYHAATGRSRSGMAFFAGDSQVVFYDWNGLQLPSQAGSLVLKKTTSAASFGDTTFWHASKTELRGFRMRLVEAADRPAPSGSSLEGGLLAMSWDAPSSQNSFAVQVKGQTIDTTLVTNSRQASLRLGSAIASRGAATSGSSIAWRVADANGLASNASRAEINGLAFSSWQALSTGASSVTRFSVGHARFAARPTADGIAFTTENGFSGEVEILDATGKRLGRVAVSGTTEFRTNAKGLLLLRSAEGSDLISRF